MVGHTGDILAARKAVTVVDRAVAEVVKEVLRHNGQILIVADHGNADEMQNTKTGALLTEHTLNRVPCIFIRRDSTKIHLRTGILADVAPTLLKVMGIEKPKEMTGKSLL
jgi:2,3-bisphosphoglycerate-independent phosphoglycerate mutase